MDLFGESIDESKEGDVSEDIPVHAFTEPEEIFDHPRRMNRFNGHRAIEKRLLELYNVDRVPHGLVFAGIKGIGKATLAYRFARFLLANGLPPDPNQDSLFGDAGGDELTSMDLDVSSQTFSLVASGAHPDLFTVERAYDESKDRYKESVEVNELRKVSPFLRMTASEGGWRIVIIDDADTMNRNAQNALLKILEEPPANTVLILVTHRLGALIPTILSRVQVMNFHPLSQDIIHEELGRLPGALNADDFAVITDLAQGSLGRALGYIEEGGVETLVKLLSILDQYPNVKWGDVHKLSEDLGRKGQERAYAMFDESFQWIYEVLVRAKARGADIPVSALQLASLQQLVKKSSLQDLVKTHENLHSLFEKTRYANLDKRQAVLGAFSMMAA